MTGRFDYVLYDAESVDKQLMAKSLVQQFEMFIGDALPPGEVTADNGELYNRYCEAKQSAIKALEECYMWVGKALKDQQALRTPTPLPLQEERVTS